MEPYEHIINHKLVTDWFGRWPAFHDAEVLSTCLDRRPLENGSGPSLTIRLHAFEMTGEVDERGHYKLVKHAIVTFEFAGMEEITLEGFNCQNVIFCLDLTEVPSDEGPPSLDVGLYSSYGVGFRFRSTFVRVNSLKPGKPSEGLYAHD
jgi:hypothetical protein